MEWLASHRYSHRRHCRRKLALLYQLQRTTKSNHKVSRLLLGGDARSVSAAPASASLRRPSENEAVLKAFNHEVLVVKSRTETRGWESFDRPTENQSNRDGSRATNCRWLPPHRPVASCGYQVQHRIGGCLKVAARLQFPVYNPQQWRLSGLYAERL